MKSSTPWLIVAGDFTPLGGMDRANHALASYLAREHEVHLVAHRVWPDLAQNPRIISHIIPRPLGKHLLGRLPLAAAGKRVSAMIRARGGRVLVNGANCPGDDLNWLHMVHNAHTAPVHGSRLHRARIAVVHHVDNLVEKYRVPRARLFYCNSRKTADDAIRTLQLPDAKVHVVYLGTDATKFGLLGDGERAAAKAKLGLEDRPHALFIGQLHNSIKNFDTLFNALCLLKDNPAWDVVMLAVGNDASAHWTERISSSGMNRYVKLFGFRDDLPAFIAAADIVLLPSRYDAYGLAAHEAICRGVPAIVSVNTGIAERFPAQLQGLILKDVENATELADLLLAWRRSMTAWPARVRPLSDALRAWTWDDMAARMVSLAEEAQ